MGEKRPASSMEPETGIVRGPTPAAGSRRATFVKFGNMVWTVSIPAGMTPGDSVATQTEKTFKELESRLAKAGTNKTRIVEATVFVKNISMKDEMDGIWRKWVPEGCEISRACVAADLAGGISVEMKVTAVLDPLTVARFPVTAPNSRRAALVYAAGLVWTVAFPAGFKPEDSVTTQTEKAFMELENRLALANTDKTRIAEMTVFVKEMSMKDEMDAVWRKWVPEGCDISRACVAADLAPGFLVEMKVTAIVEAFVEITRMPVPAAGSRRAAFVSAANLVWTVAFPAGFKPEDSMTVQTEKSLEELDRRLEKAGTDKTRIIEATVFVKSMSLKDEMDAVWRKWVPAGCDISRACVEVDLAPGFLVEMKVTAAAA